MNDFSMCWRAVSIAAIAVLFPLALAADPSIQTAMAISLNTSSIVISGLTPGGQVVIFGRSCTSVRGKVRLIRHALVRRDDDRDGVVTLPMEIAPSSAFIAVDYETGQFATAAPNGASPRVIPTLHGQQWQDGAETVDLNRGYLDFLVVRPRKGAWVLDVFQGSLRDADGVVDGTLRLRMSSMQPLLGKDSPPPHVTKKDVLAIIDPRNLDVQVMAAE